MFDPERYGVLGTNWASHIPLTVVLDYGRKCSRSAQK